MLCLMCDADVTVNDAVIKIANDDVIADVHRLLLIQRVQCVSILCYSLLH